MTTTTSGRTAVIIGAGPAGLTAALELLERTDVVPVVLEASPHVGGLSRTATYKGYRMDIGGHRFFSKSDRVMDWWLDILPMQETPRGGGEIAYQGKRREVEGGPGADPERDERVMLLRERRSRIYFLRKFFDYPISLTPGTVAGLGLWRTMRIGASYVRSALFPIRDERNLEEFFVNRFGRELYETFFKSYTEKVWGVPCREIRAEWGAQRVKGLSVTTAVVHVVKKVVRPQRNVAQKGTETSLIEQFLYPKYGPGQMWEEVARMILERGGRILPEHPVVRVLARDGRAEGVVARDAATGEEVTFRADFVFSTMAVRDLLGALEPAAPPGVREVSDGLVYRDFITVGLLVERLKVREDGANGGTVRDNWIYIQEPDVLLGRLQIFNNWSPYLVADPSKIWLGLEYFCNETDDLWTMSDEAVLDFAADELARIGIVDRADVLDGTVLRVPKTYPAYFGTYDRFDVVREYVDSIENLFLIGRNGMHKYNNQDHSMLTAMVAVDNIAEGRTDKSNLWEVNTEQEYHESKPG